MSSIYLYLYFYFPTTYSDMHFYGSGEFLLCKSINKFSECQQFFICRVTAMRVFQKYSMNFQVGALNVLLNHKPILGVSNVYRSFQLNVNSVDDFLHKRKMQQDAVLPGLSMGLQDQPITFTNDSDDDHSHRAGEHSETRLNKKLSLPQLSSIFHLHRNNKTDMEVQNFRNENPLEIKNSYEENRQTSISEKSHGITNEVSRSTLGRMLFRNKSQPKYFDRFDTFAPLDNSQKLLWSVSELCCSYQPEREINKVTHNSQVAVNDYILPKIYDTTNKFEEKYLDKTKKYPNLLDESEETDLTSPDLLFPWKHIIKSQNVKEGDILDHQKQTFTERKSLSGFNSNKNFHKIDCEKDEKGDRTNENKEGNNNFKRNHKVYGQSSKKNVKKSHSRFNRVVRYFPLRNRSWTTLYQNPLWKYRTMMRHLPWIHKPFWIPYSVYIH